MEFHEKLSFLMDITNTSNSALARHLILDPSYISRLKSGKRLAPKNQELIGKMGTYFLRNAQEGYQRKAITDTLGVSISADGADLSSEISHWLASDTPSISFMRTPQDKAIFDGGKTHFPKQEATVYYGVKGKRQAILYALDRIIALEKPHTLLLFSDEESSWMTGDPEYMKKWNVAMNKIVTSGHKIIIIHTISRHLDEMLSAIYHWIPLYMSGVIEPYYYPKKRDGVFRRTLFVVPGLLAMVSSSVGEATEKAANVVLHCHDTVAAYEEEFNKFLELCVPLMTVYTEKDKGAAIRTLKDFEVGDSPAIVKSESLAPVSMPADLFKKLLQKSGYPGHISYDFNFKQRFTEIIKLPSAEDLLAGHVKMATSFMMTDKNFYYKPEEYIYHIENIIYLLKNKENYYVSLVKDSLENRYAVYNKSHMGTIVGKTSAPPVMLAMNEANMTASFEDFLSAMIDDRFLSPEGKKTIINEFESYIKEVKTLLNKEESNVQ